MATSNMSNLKEGDIKYLVTGLECLTSPIKVCSLLTAVS